MYDRKFVSRLARNLKERELIEVRRIAEGTQLRRTDIARLDLLAGPR